MAWFFLCRVYVYTISYTLDNTYACNNNVSYNCGSQWRLVVVFLMSTSYTSVFIEILYTRRNITVPKYFVIAKFHKIGVWTNSRRQRCRINQEKEIFFFLPLSLLNFLKKILEKTFTYTCTNDHNESI